MANSYIITIDSLSTTFSPIDAGKEVLFTYESSDQSLPSDIDTDDILIGYYGGSVKEFRIVFRVTSRNADSLTLSKEIEKASGIPLSCIGSELDEYLDMLDEPGSLIPIDSNRANDLRSNLESQSTMKKRKASTSSGTTVTVTETNLRLLAAIKTKPFIILGGFSGTGKSQKVKELAYLTCPDELKEDKGPGNYCLIAVKPNWHDSRDLLGFSSSISKNYKVTPFMKFLIKAMKTPDTPFYCCIDEMNLALVEEYFAEYLSKLEGRSKCSGKIICPPLVDKEIFTKNYENFDIFKELGLDTTEDDDIIRILKDEGLCIPDNLVVMGTVNMDDTTNGFSRKVIDRALIFETDIEKFDQNSYFNTVNPLEWGNVDGKQYLCDEVDAKMANTEGRLTIPEENKNGIIEFVNEINEKMAGTSFQVSYRVINEALLYNLALTKLDPLNATLDRVENDILMMKVLPRIEGDTAARSAVEGLRDYIISKCPDDWKNININTDTSSLTPTVWSESRIKIAYMEHLLGNEGEGFTRFWK